MKIGLRRSHLDPKADEVILRPLEYICSRNGINMSLNFRDKDADVIIRYRFPIHPKRLDKPHGIMIDDFPPLIYDENFRKNLKTFDFYIVFNKRIGEFLVENFDKKPVIYYPGVVGKELFQELGVLQKKKEVDKNLFLPIKKAAIINSLSYGFNIKDFLFDGWNILYFAERDLNIPQTTFRPYSKLTDFYKSLSEFSPDIVLQPWVDEYSFNFKSNLKMRDSMIIESCLVAQDKGNLYNITNGVNGFKWNDMAELKDIMQNTDIEAFHKIGLSHKFDDKEIATKLYNDIVALTR